MSKIVTHWHTSTVFIVGLFLVPAAVLLAKDHTLVCLFSMILHRYAASIDDILEEEEHYADQIKEYLFYAEALR